MKKNCTDRIKSYVIQRHHHHHHSDTKTNVEPRSRWVDFFFNSKKTAIMCSASQLPNSNCNTTKLSIEANQHDRCWAAMAIHKKKEFCTVLIWRSVRALIGNSHMSYIDHWNETVYATWAKQTRSTLFGCVTCRITLVYDWFVCFQRSRISFCLFCVLTSSAPSRSSMIS